MKYIFLNLAILLLFSANTSKQIIIVIDPGHGGYDSGAVGKYYRTKEKDVNLGVALNLYKLLKNNPNFKPIITRKEDLFIPLKKRAAISNYFHPDLFLAIHCNQFTTNAQGCEIYYLKNTIVKNKENQRKSIIAAYTILNDLQKSLEFKKRKILPANFSVLRNTNKVSPSILIEVAYLSNQIDENYIKEKHNQKVIAMSIYKSLKHLYNK